jgi:hypothetical protein
MVRHGRSRCTDVNIVGQWLSDPGRAGQFPSKMRGLGHAQTGRCPQRWDGAHRFIPTDKGNGKRVPLRSWRQVYLRVTWRTGGADPDDARAKPALACRYRPVGVAECPVRRQMGAKMLLK